MAYAAGVTSLSNNRYPERPGEFYERVPRGQGGLRNFSCLDSGGTLLGVDGGTVPHVPLPRSYNLPLDSDLGLNPLMRKSLYQKGAVSPLLRRRSYFYG